MNQVLNNAELLQNIVAHAHGDQRTLATISSVSRFWHEMALDTIWYEVINLFHLFSALAPLKLEAKGEDTTSVQYFVSIGFANVTA